MKIKKEYLTLLGRPISLKKKFKVIEWTLRNHDLWGPFPLYAQIELNSSCNLSCIMCNRSRFATGEYMKMDKFKELLDKIPTVCHIQPYGFGEPFLHPKFLEMMEYAHYEKGMVWSVTTNGTLLHKHDLHKLLCTGPLRIIVSIDHPVPEEYNKIRPGADFYKLKNNVLNLIEARDSLFGKKGWKRPKILMTSPIAMDRLNIIPELIELKDEWGFDGLRIKDMVWPYEVGPSVINNSIIQNMRPADVDEMLSPYKDRNDISFFLKKPEKRTCVWPKNQIYISVEGNITACSCGYEVFPKLGNIFEMNSIMDVWNTPVWDVMRQGTIDANGDYQFCWHCEGWAEDMSDV